MATHQLVPVKPEMSSSAVEKRKFDQISAILKELGQEDLLDIFMKNKLTVRIDKFAAIYSFPREFSEYVITTGLYYCL
jgi:hypothetical protein